VKDIPQRPAPEEIAWPCGMAPCHDHIAVASRPRAQTDPAEPNRARHSVRRLRREGNQRPTRKIGDLVSYQNGGKGCTMIAGNVGIT